MKKSAMYYLLNGFVKMYGKMSRKSKAATPLEPVYVDFLDSSDSGSFTVGFHKKAVLPDDIDTKKYYIAGRGKCQPIFLRICIKLRYLLFFNHISY